MTIENENGWAAVELAAQTAELANVETPKVPTPTVAQQLAFLAVRCAELQAKLKRKDGAIATAIMWLSLGEVGRANAEMNRGLLDL